MSGSRQTETSYLINAHTFFSDNNVVIDFNNDKTEAIDNISAKFDLKRKSKVFGRETMPNELIFHIMDFLPNCDLANLSEASKEFNDMVITQTARGKLISQFINIKPSFLSASFTYFSKPEGMGQYLPYIFSFGTTALSTTVGIALPGYIFYGGHLDYLCYYGGVISGAIGSTIGSATTLIASPGSAYLPSNSHFFASVPTAIGGTGLGGIIMATALTHESVLSVLGSAGTGVGGGAIGGILGIFGVSVLKLREIAHKTNQTYLEKQQTERNNIKKELKKLSPGF